MRALVTGAGGFLGRYVAESLLKRGDHVCGLARKPYPELKAHGIEMFQGDIRDAECVHRLCREVDVVFHTAAIAGIWGPWEKFHQINTIGTRNVIAGCVSQAVPKLVYTSSPSVTFDGRDQIQVDESAPYANRWLCHYSHSKALGEQLILEANGKNGLLTCALRPHLIWGPRDQHLIPRLIRRAKQGKLMRVGDGQNLVDMIYVENAAQAHLQAADHLEEGSPVAGQAYFLSQGEPVNCWDWIDEILSMVGLEALKKSISLRKAYRIGAVMEFVYSCLRIRSEPRMTRFLATQLATSHYFDITRAKRDFGYLPEVSIADGMRELHRWLETEGEFESGQLTR